MVSIVETKMIAGICKLRFDDNELAHMTKQLSSIVKMMDQLEQISCSGVEPIPVYSSHIKTRPDEVKQTVTVDELFANAPEPSASIAKEVKYFIVPKVIE